MYKKICLAIVIFITGSPLFGMDRLPDHTEKYVGELVQTIEELSQLEKVLSDIRSQLHEITQSKAAVISKSAFNRKKSRALAHLHNKQHSDLSVAFNQKKIELENELERRSSQQRYLQHEVAQKERALEYFINSHSAEDKASIHAYMSYLLNE